MTEDARGEAASTRSIDDEGSNHTPLSATESKNSTAAKMNLKHKASCTVERQASEDSMKLDGNSNIDSNAKYQPDFTIFYMLLHISSVLYFFTTSNLNGTV